MSDTQLIKDKLDIVDLISEYVQLKPAGVNHKGLCPFHQEKSPSFMVNRDRQNFHCFGCAKGGDIFTFVEEVEGMEFVEALKYLANKAGVQLTREFQNQAQSSQKNRLKDVNAVAAVFFHNVLTKIAAAKPAQTYLEERGLSEETIEAWQIGYVPDQWDLLTQYLLKKGHSIDDLVAAGLTIKRDNASMQSGKGYYDRFRGRIMFPIHDVHGAVIGFTGRVLVETEKSGGKYVNTPQSPVYDKSRVVYGLYKSKKEIRSKDLIVVVEGQMDVVASHQAGLKNVVASSGTAFTEEQIKLVKRYSNNMAMAFDMDEAGIKAAKRGIAIAVADGMNVKVIQIPEGRGKDPDECIKENRDVWFQSVADAKSVMQWHVDRAFANRDLKDPKQKQDAVNEVLPEISNIPFAVEQDHWVQEVAGKLGVDSSVLRIDMDRLQRTERGVRMVLRQSGEQNNNTKADVKKSRLELLIERFFALLSLFPTATLQLPSIQIVETTLYKRMYSLYTDNSSLNIDELRESLDSPQLKGQLDILLMKGELEFSDMLEEKVVVEGNRLVKDIEDEWKKEKRKKLQREIEIAERAKDKDLLQTLLEQFQQY